MRLFWKDHAPLILVFSVQMLLIPFIYWLAGNRQWLLALYSLLLSSTLLLLYLLYRWLTLKKFYRQLSDVPQSLEQALDSPGEAPLADALNGTLQANFRLYREELYRYEKRMEQHTAFINRWVHQMKTPLSVIQLTMQDREDSGADSIQEEVDRLKQGLDMVLHTSRLDNFQHDFHVKVIGLRSVVNQAVAENRRLFIRNQIRPAIQVNEQTFVYSDEKWLVFVIGQLAINAVKYSAGVGDEVVFASYLRGTSTVLEIKDRGIGIAKEDRRRVFEPYFTGQQGRNYKESTGMGLYLVREVCGRLGHQVELESESGEGTTVRLVFRREGPV